MFPKSIKNHQRYLDFDNSSSQNSPSHGGLDLKDFIKRNINLGKDTSKNVEFDKQRSIINRVHNKIIKKKDYVFDVNGLSALQIYLSPKLKQQFLSNPNYQETFAEANLLNKAFLNVTE
jgi:hypothetical protein